LRNSSLRSVGIDNLPSAMADMVREAFVSKKPLAEKLREDAQIAEKQYPL